MPTSTKPPLRDYLREGLDVVFVGINPGMRSAAAGHHYAGPGNHFWPLLHEAGFVSEPLTHADDARVLEWNIGLTNMVARATPSMADLSLQDLRDGARLLEAKLLRYRPRVVCFNGKRIADVYFGRPCTMGRQPDRIGDSVVYVMPSTSPRGASYQKADKLRFFRELKRIVEGAQDAAAPRRAS